MSFEVLDPGTPNQTLMDPNFLEVSGVSHGCLPIPIGLVRDQVPGRVRETRSVWDGLNWSPDGGRSKGLGLWRVLGIVWDPFIHRPSVRVASGVHLARPCHLARGTGRVDWEGGDNPDMSSLVWVSLFGV